MEVDSPQSQGGGDATRGRLKGLAQKARVFSAFESALATLSPSAQRRQGASRVLESAGKRASLADEPEPPEPIGTPELQPEDARSGEKVLELARKAARKEIENRRASRRVPSVGAQVSEALTPGSPAGAATNRLLNLVQEVQEREQERRALHNALMMKKDNELAAVLHREQRKNDTLRAKIADLEDALAGMQRKLEDAERAVQTAYRPTVLVQPGSSLHLSGDDDEERLSAEDEVKRLRRRVQRLEEVCSLQKKRLEGDESYLMYVKTCQKRVADLQFVLRRTEEVKSELQRLKEDTVGRFALALPQMLADEIERLVPSLKVVVTAQTENAKKAAASRFAHAMAPKGKQAQQPTPPQPPAPQQQPTPDSAPSQVQEAAAPAAGPVLSAAQLDSLSDELGNLREALGIPPDRAAREEAQGTPSWVHTVWKGFSDDATFPIPPLTAADVGSADSLAAVMSGFISFAFSATTHATAAFDEAASQEQTPSAKPRRVSASRRRSSRNRRPSKATTAASGKEPLFTPPQPPSQRLLPPSVAEGGGDDLADAAMAALSVCSEDAMAECDADQLKEKVQQMAGFTAALSGQVQEERRVRDELLQELSDMRALVQRLQSEDPAGLRRLQADEVGSGPSRRGSTRRSVHKSPGAPPLKPIPSVSSIQQSSVAAASTSYRGKPSQASHRSASHASGGAALSSRSPQRRSDGSVSVPHYDGVSAHGSKHELDVPEDVVVMHEGSAGSPALVVTDHALAADSDGPGLGRADDGGGGGDAGGVVEEEDGADEQAGKPADRHKVYCYVCGSGPYRDLGSCPQCGHHLYYGIAIGAGRRLALREEIRRQWERWTHEARENAGKVRSKAALPQTTLWRILAARNPKLDAETGAPSLDCDEDGGDDVVLLFSRGQAASRKGSAAPHRSCPDAAAGPLQLAASALNASLAQRGEGRAASPPLGGQVWIDFPRPPAVPVPPPARWDRPGGRKSPAAQEHRVWSSSVGPCRRTGRAHPPRARRQMYRGVSLPSERRFDEYIRNRRVLRPRCDDGSLRTADQQPAAEPLLPPI